MSAAGYLNPLYAQSFIEFGEPFELPACKGWILKRPIPNVPFFDGMGTYPIFTCENWAGLEEDLNHIGDQLVSLSLVTDPFGKYSQEDLLRYFKNVARHYKEHFVVDLRQQPQSR